MAFTSGQLSSILGSSGHAGNIESMTGGGGGGEQLGVFASGVGANLKAYGEQQLNHDLEASTVFRLATGGMTDMMKCWDNTLPKLNNFAILAGNTGLEGLGLMNALKTPTSIMSSLTGKGQGR